MTSVEIGKIVSDRYTLWKKNLILSVPFIFNAVITMGLMIVAFFSLFLPKLQTLLSQPSEMTSAEIFSELMITLTSRLSFIVLVLIALVVIIARIGAFLNAGAIGMAKEAILKGKTTLSTMVTYGKKKVLNLFGANLIVGVIMSLSLLFLLPGIFTLLPYTSSSVDSNTVSMTEMIPLFIGLFFMAVYGLLLSLVFFLVNYAVVIDDLRAVEGVKTGIHMFFKQKLAVFLLWLLLIVLAFVLGLLSVIPYIGGFLVFLVSLIVYLPLITLWVTNLYLTISKPVNT
jgi:hypothetical protein